MAAGSRLGTASIVLGTGLVLAVAACRSGPHEETAPPAKASTQGWGEEQRLSWYQGTQGSRLMPLSWAQALEQAGGNQLFFTPEHLATYRFVPLEKSVAKLPIGFAIDQQDDSKLTFSKLRWYQGQPANERWVGLNCSACHTAQITHQGQTMTIDGGPSLVDFQAFIEGVDSAMASTQNDPAKWDRFAAKVLAGKDNAQNRAALKTSFDSLVAWYKDNARLNDTPLRYGYGRLDAFGHIFNKVAQLAVYGTRVRATPNAADAPVSYPFLWNIFRQNKLQWNGIVEAKRLNLGKGYLDYGALGRNTGEVIGVFGDVDIVANSNKMGFPSSIEASNLDRLENVLRKLEPPKWPESLGALNQDRIKAGGALFQNKGCAGCHQIEAPGTSIYQVHMIPLTRDSQKQENRNNTDPWMACNAISYTSNTGKLEGQPENYFRGDPLEKNEPLATMLSTTVIGTLVGKWKQILSTAADIFIGTEKLPRVVGAGTEVSPAERKAGRLEQCFNSKNPLFAYKARPLDGIWATAPYLHNGSVPTLYDLLLPPEKRPASFNVGTREFDPAKVGYRTGADAAGNGFTFTASGDGNSNRGHDYNVGGLSEEERLALLEFLKTL
ncbi:hypothetical protein E2493_00090 [Sphingomonas parva]|uniref:Cytochrome c domain-containing protein n=1 Tax=Sphingomonas parva TaxID=2555898 RepID=A0A4Y8ZW75_9SPHN|nr:di-heme-cytochrome C peroxidase [Sphingomonas parva]TFI60154.1 hypothetical protein E2493_00090 [Sphingomonas parva]